MRKLSVCMLLLACLYSEKVIHIYEPIASELVSDEPLQLVSETGIEVMHDGKIIAPTVRFTSVDAPHIHGEVIADEIFICCQKGKLNLDDAKLSGAITIDPKNVLIQSGGSDPATGNTFTTNPAADVIIDGATLAIAIDSAPVTIQANTDITIDDTVVTSTFGNGLTLQAGRSILFAKNSHITLNGGALACTINDEGAQADDRVNGEAVFSLAQGSAVFTQGGDMTVSVGSFGGSNIGHVVLQYAVIDAAGGNISLEGFAGEPFLIGVSVQSSDILTEGSGTITLNGHGSDIGTKCYGLFLYVGSSDMNQIRSENGAITLTGVGGNGGSGYTYNHGILITRMKVETTGTGDVIVNGTAGVGENRNYGVSIGSYGSITTADGNVNLTGTGHGTGQQNLGVGLAQGGQITNTHSGTITINGTGGNGTDYNYGLGISGVGCGIIAVDGAITIVGNGMGVGAVNSGISLESGGCIKSTGSGSIDLTGTASMNSIDRNMGVFLAGKNTHVKGVDGNISLTGVSYGTDIYNQGIRLESGVLISSTGVGVGAGAITLSGTGGTGASLNNGTVISSGSTVSSIDGDITLTGKSLVPGTPGLTVAADAVTSLTGIITENSIEP